MIGATAVLGGYSRKGSLAGHPKSQCSRYLAHAASVRFCSLRSSRHDVWNKIDKMSVCLYVACRLRECKHSKLGPGAEADAAISDAFMFLTKVSATEHCLGRHDPAVA